jgi:hypothetical protein
MDIAKKLRIWPKILLDIVIKSKNRVNNFLRVGQIIKIRIKFYIFFRFFFSYFGGTMADPGPFSLRHWTVFFTPMLPVI